MDSKEVLEGPMSLSGNLGGFMCLKNSLAVLIQSKRILGGPKEVQRGPYYGQSVFLDFPKGPKWVKGLRGFAILSPQIFSVCFKFSQSQNIKI